MLVKNVMKNGIAISLLCFCYYLMIVLRRQSYRYKYTTQFSKNKVSFILFSSVR